MSRETAIQLYNRALELLPGDSATAYRFFASAVTVDPSFTEGWYAVGNANSDLSLGEASIACYRRLVELNPEDAKAWCNMGERLYHLGRNFEASVAIDKAIDLEPTLGYAWCTRSRIHLIWNHPVVALECAKKAFKLAPGPAVEMGLAFAYLFNKDWANGFKHFEARFPYKLKHHLHYPYPAWAGEDEPGKTLLLIADQGLGDTLSFMRFVPWDLKNTQVVLQVQNELVRVCAAMFTNKPHVTVGPVTQALPAADYWCSITGLPHAMGLSNREIEAARTPKVPFHQLGASAAWKVPGRKLHVGIAWAGAPDNGIDMWRSMNLPQFLDLYRVPGIQLYSLQIGPRAQDIHDCGALALVKDLAPYIRDVSDTGAVMRDLDLVICVESGPRHIAAAHGVECWTLCSHLGRDWRCGIVDERPLWDKRTRIFRQGTDARWEPVIEDVVAALRKRVEG